MQISLFYITIAIFLAEKIQSAPILGLPALPLVNPSAINGLANTAAPVPLVGQLTQGALESSSAGSLLPVAGLTGHQGLINPNGLLGDITNGLQRRQVGMPVVGDVANTVGSVIPAGLATLAAAPNFLLSALPAAGLVPSRRKRGTEDGFGGISSLPLIGSLPSSGLTSALPGMNYQGAGNLLSALGSQSGSSGATNLGGLTSVFPGASLASGPSGILNALPMSGLLPSLRKRDTQDGSEGFSPMSLLSSLPLSGLASALPGTNSQGGGNLLSALGSQSGTGGASNLGGLTSMIPGGSRASSMLQGLTSDFPMGGSTGASNMGGLTSALSNPQSLAKGLSSAFPTGSSTGASDAGGLTSALSNPQYLAKELTSALPMGGSSGASNAAGLTSALSNPQSLLSGANGLGGLTNLLR